MNQEKTGRFIASARNRMGLTQRELAEQIGVSDKTISKWECGKSMPDISYLDTLCTSLNINMNELISGEMLTEQDYSKKAEENIMALMKENEKTRKGSAIKSGIGIMLAVFAIFLMFSFMQHGLQSIIFYLDIPTIILLVLLNAAGILLSGRRSFDGILEVLQHTAVPHSLIVVLVSLVFVLLEVKDLSLLGANLAVCIIPVLYGLAEYLTVYFVRQHIGKNM